MEEGEPKQSSALKQAFPPNPTYIALATNHLIAVVLASQSLERWFNNTTTQTKNKMQSRFLSRTPSANRYLSNVTPSISHLLNIIVAQGPSIFELFSSKDQPLLIWGNSFLVLDLAFDIVDCITGFDLESDGLAREGLDEAGRIALVLVPPL